jgi:competence ComEA-like helix-hairpin-helix protein
VKALLEKRVPLAWLLLMAIGTGAAVIVWKIAVLDAPPQGAAFIVSGQSRDGPSATITPFAALVDNAPATIPTNCGLENVDCGFAADTSRSALSNLQSTPTPSMALISVYVSGAVSRPGVYTLPLGSRIDSAVAAAGGALPDADLDGINLAEKLSDEAHVRVYRIGEVAAATQTTTSGAQTVPSQAPHSTSPTARQAGSQPTTPPRQAGTTTPATKPTPSVKINLNTATAEDLQQIPGIGPVIAQRIIADRKANGPYRSVEDLMRISGIKEGILARLRNYVTVGP